MIPDAACTGVPTALFFPSGEDFRAANYDVEARRVRDSYCRQCPVPARQACARLYSRFAPQEGVWAGTIQSERNQPGFAFPTCPDCGALSDPYPRKPNRCTDCRTKEQDASARC